MRRMRNVHVDVPDLGVGLVDHHHFIGSLDEIDWLKAAGKDQELRNTGRHAVCARRSPHPFGEQFLVSLFQALDDPGFQIRIAQIRQAQRRFHDVASRIGIARHPGMRLVVAYGSWTSQGRKKAGSSGDPGKSGGGKVRDRTLGTLTSRESLRSRGAGAKETNEKTDWRHLRHVFLRSKSVIAVEACNMLCRSPQTITFRRGADKAGGHCLLRGRQEMAKFSPFGSPCEQAIKAKRTSPCD